MEQMLYLLDLVHAYKFLPAATIEGQGGVAFNAFQFTRWFHSSRKLNQKELDTLVETVVVSIPKGLEQRDFEKSLIAKLEQQELFYLGHGGMFEDLNGKSKVYVPENIEIPKGIEAVVKKQYDQGADIVLKYSPEKAVQTSDYIYYFQKPESRMSTIWQYVRLFTSPLKKLLHRMAR